jgi:hypothetical protein
MTGDEQADQIVANFQSSLNLNGTTTTFDAFLTLLDKYFTPRTNIVAQRAQFFDRRETDDESTKSSSGRCLPWSISVAKNLKDEHLRDKPPDLSRRFVAATNRATLSRYERP